MNVTLIFALRRHAEVIEAYLTGLERLAAAGGDLARQQRRVVLREPGRHRDRPAAPRRSSAARQGRGRQREAGLPAVRAFLLRARVGKRSRRRARAAAAAVGVDVDEEPGVLPHALRRRAHRPRHGEHARAGVDRRAADPRRAPARNGRPKGSTTPAAIARARGAGVDFDDVTDTLEREGVDSFSASFHDALDTLAKKARVLDVARRVVAPRSRQPVDSGGSGEPQVLGEHRRRGVESRWDSA